jgi:hypothetical protein
MSYKVDGTKVNTLSTLLGRAIHASAGILAGSLTKGTVMKAMQLENEVSVVEMIEHRKSSSIDEGVTKKVASDNNAPRSKKKNKEKSTDEAPAQSDDTPSEGVTA